jgi:hypothetical protein
MLKSWMATKDVAMARGKNSISRRPLAPVLLRMMLRIYSALPGINRDLAASDWMKRAIPPSCGASVGIRLNHQNP